MSPAKIQSKKKNFKGLLPICQTVGSSPMSIFLVNGSFRTGLICIVYCIGIQILSSSLYNGEGVYIKQNKR